MSKLTLLSKKKKIKDKNNSTLSEWYGDIKDITQPNEAVIKDTISEGNQFSIPSLSTVKLQTSIEASPELLHRGVIEKRSSFLNGKTNLNGLKVTRNYEKDLKNSTSMSSFEFN